MNMNKVLVLLKIDTNTMASFEVSTSHMDKVQVEIEPLRHVCEKTSCTNFFDTVFGQQTSTRIRHKLLTFAQSVYAYMLPGDHALG
jgi:hypothetical protein